MTRPTSRPKATRRGHLAAIHITEKGLNLSKDDASALKRDITGVDSSADMDARQRAQYLAHLAVLQAHAAKARGEKPAYDPKRPALVRNIGDQHDLQWSYARALWHNLAVGGEVKTDTDLALMAYAKRQTGVDAWRFMTPEQIQVNVIEGLKKWCRRCGVPVRPQPGGV